MQRLVNTLREHRHAFIVVALLTLVMTFPTIVYIFKTDVFWHPAGTSRDVYIKFWDIWHGKQFLAGQADALYHTEAMFYPEGLSLAYHPLFIPHIIVVNALSILLPVSNAFSLAYLLIIALCALSAYIYLVWLFNDRWIAIFGAVVFGFSPHVVGHPSQPEIACIATIPLALYCIHRGMLESRRALVFAAGLLTGLTTVISLYMYVCSLILLGFLVCAFAVSEWREKRCWLNVALLIVTVSIMSAWRIYPLLNNADSPHELTAWHGGVDINTDAVSFFVNHKNPFFSRPLHSILSIVPSNQLSASSYLGYLPLLLIGVGLFAKASRRRMAPWAFLLAAFLILRLGPHLHINGADYADILLPKYYLNQLLPVVFGAFWAADQFMMGALLPFAVLACYGLVALRKRCALAAKPAFILALIAIVALEYYNPVETERLFPEGDGTISSERLAFLDWLGQQDGEIRLINLPMGRIRAKIYNLYQSLSGYPHAEGAISRTPESAFDYIRANFALNAWLQHLPINCEWVDRDDYIASMTQLEADGFSHVVYHLGFGQADVVGDSFRDVEASYADGFVRIYGLNSIRESCTEAHGALHSFNRLYAGVLQQPQILEEGRGVLLIFPPSIRASKSFSRNLHRFGKINRAVANVTIDEQANIDIRFIESPAVDSNITLDQFAALWVVNSPETFDAEQTPAFRDWFAQQFRFCRRAQADDSVVLDLYLWAGIPCSAMDESSALDIQFDSGVRLHNASFALDGNMLSFYLTWSNPATIRQAFSLQLFDESGDKALQHDQVIRRPLLSTQAIDISSLAAGDYSIQLIVYDFETQVSQGGTIRDSGQRFARELEIGRIEVTP